MEKEGQYNRIFIKPKNKAKILTTVFKSDLCRGHIYQWSYYCKGHELYKEFSNLESFENNRSGTIKSPHQQFYKMVTQKFISQNRWCYFQCSFIHYFSSLTSEIDSILPKNIFDQKPDYQGNLQISDFSSSKFEFFTKFYTVS